MRVLITGGAGFIGSNIVRRVLEFGHKPVVLDNISSSYRENLVSGVAFFEGDVRDREVVPAPLMVAVLFCIWRRASGMRGRSPACTA